MENETKWLNTKQVSVILGKNHDTIRRYFRKGTLNGNQNAMGDWQTTQANVDAFIAGQPQPELPTNEKPKEEEEYEEEVIPEVAEQLKKAAIAEAKVKAINAEIALQEAEGTRRRPEHLKEWEEKVAHRDVQLDTIETELDEQEEALATERISIDGRWQELMEKEEALTQREAEAGVNIMEADKYAETKRVEVDAEIKAYVESILGDLDRQLEQKIADVDAQCRAMVITAKKERKELVDKINTRIRALNAWEKKLVKAIKTATEKCQVLANDKKYFNDCAKSMQKWYDYYDKETMTQGLKRMFSGDSKNATSFIKFMLNTAVKMDGIADTYSRISLPELPKLDEAEAQEGIPEMELTNVEEVVIATTPKPTPKPLPKILESLEEEWKEPPMEAPLSDFDKFMKTIFMMK